MIPDQTDGPTWAPLLGEQQEIPGTPPRREDPAQLSGDMVEVRALIPADVRDRINERADRIGIPFAFAAGEVLGQGLEHLEDVDAAIKELGG